MKQSQFVYLNATPVNKRWYFQVSSVFDQSKSFHIVSLPVKIPVPGVLVPGSKPFGKIFEAINEFERSCTDRVKEVVEKNERHYDALYASLGLEKHLSSGEVSALKEILEEKAKEKAKFKKTGKFILSRSTKKEVEPGEFGLWQDAQGNE
ncbi:hypothetical protein D1R32_gp034 [Tunisvirus fontaine2]|uniref:Uncharacterized protein n=1 Tax=Tunisvirus fontaine2 TaxID=1421067 RepID=V9SEL7_9VIRU|nr:hypothetical protein D1R32_gp034 [Tunisvirus fontaine2]AHC54751.1 hypothetical protein TNS_ORF33 [Tunisvirus fontaine2]